MRRKIETFRLARQTRVISQCNIRWRICLKKPTYWSSEVCTYLQRERETCFQPEHLYGLPIHLSLGHSPEATCTACGQCVKNLLYSDKLKMQLNFQIDRTDCFFFFLTYYRPSISLHRPSKIIVAGSLYSVPLTTTPPPRLLTQTSGLKFILNIVSWKNIEKKWSA